MSAREAGATAGALAGRFEFASVGRIVFGRGQVIQVAELAGRMGRTALVVTNAGQRGEGGAVDRVADLLEAAGVRTGFVQQGGEPTVDDVDRAAAVARADGCDVVIGLGGGSAIDAAKAVAALLTNGGQASDYMEVVGKGQKLTAVAAPWIAVPTTAGTGAEVTKNAVISFPAKRFKASIRGEQLLARAVVVDPELGVGVPPAVTAASGMDALCQLIESYTSTGAQPMTDALAIAGIPRAVRGLPRAFRNGSDVPAREDMALAALLSGITLANAGLGAVHGFAAPMGAYLPIPHGVICAALLPHVMAANVAALRAEAADHPVLARYADVGRALTGREEADEPEAIDAGVAAVAALAGDLEIPPLGQFGLTEAGVDELVGLARKSSSMRYNPVVLSDAALAGVLRAAM